MFDTDEGPRKDSSIESLAKLKPAFKADGKVTAGNASSMNDGAAAIVIASRAYAEKNDLKPIAKIVGYSQAALEPKYLFAAQGSIVGVEQVRDEQADGPAGLLAQSLGARVGLVIQGFCSLQDARSRFLGDVAGIVQYA